MALVKEACAAAAGLSTAPAMLQPIREFVENEPIAKAGGSRKSFVYDLSVFGLNEDGIRERFAGVF